METSGFFLLPLFGNVSKSITFVSQNYNQIQFNPTVKVAKDTFLIRVHSDRNSDIGIVGSNGNKIIIDVDYNKYKHSVQTGIIHACPIRVTDQYLYDTPVEVGDTVFFHHFVCQPDHKIGDNIYRAEYFHLYAKIENDKVMPIEDVIFVLPIKEDEENMYAGNIRIKAFQENLKQTGIVFASSKKAQAAGIFAGDKIYYTKSAEYPMRVVDHDLYRMRIRNVMAVERNGELVAPVGKVLVKMIESDNKLGSFYDAGAKIELKGEVALMGEGVVGVEQGDEISYFMGVTGFIEYKGQKYSLIETRNINYIIDKV